ncbi:MAG: hypothetical protein WA884_05395 [Methyloceanibacter sp.]
MQALELSSKNAVWLVGEPPIDAKNQRGQKLLLGPVRSSARIRATVAVPGSRHYGVIPTAAKCCWKDPSRRRSYAGRDRGLSVSRVEFTSFGKLPNLEEPIAAVAAVVDDADRKFGEYDEFAASLDHTLRRPMA